MKNILVLLLVVSCGKDSGGGDKGGGGGGGGAQTTEAKLLLNKLGTRAKSYFVEKAKFPSGHAGPTGCGKADWSDPVWKELDFSADEPTKFKYSYDSDGKTFTGTATACEGSASLKIEGASEAGNATTKLSE